MDMTRHLRRYINLPELEKLDGYYEGVIADVTEQPLRNRFTYRKEVNPIILFEDGYCTVPNNGMRRALIEEFGKETDLWKGRSIIVASRPVSESQQQEEQRSARKQKCVIFPREEIGRSAPAREGR